MASRLVHCIALCRDCSWECQDYKTAARKAREHHRKTGHKIGVETAYCYVIGEK